MGIFPFSCSYLMERMSEEKKWREGGGRDIWYIFGNKMPFLRKTKFLVHDFSLRERSVKYLCGWKWHSQRHICSLHKTIVTLWKSVYSTESVNALHTDNVMTTSILLCVHDSMTYTIYTRIVIVTKAIKESS